MPDKLAFLKLGDPQAAVPNAGQNALPSAVFTTYVETIVNKKLRTYQHIIHNRGPKSGQSYFSHVLDLVTLAEQIRVIAGLSEIEMCCILLALTIHDMNKIEPYGRGPDGRELSYTDAASPENIATELERLEAREFFADWREYRYDITLLAHYHQESATGTLLVIDQRIFAKCTIAPRRLKTLKHLMKALDVADMAHSADYSDPDEMHNRDRILHHIHSAIPGRRYRFVGHRLAELRGLFTNVIHNQLVAFFQSTYGQDACIPLQRYPEGIHYLLDASLIFEWSETTLRKVAGNIQTRFEEIQLEDLAKFIKPASAGISVDDAAIESGATMAQIFACIINKVKGKDHQYTKAGWREERNHFATNDLQKALADALVAEDLKEQVRTYMQRGNIVTPDIEVLKRGEFLSAYRKFLEDHRTSELKKLKTDAWTRVFRLYQLPPEYDRLYKLIDSFRRGYVLAQDIPDLTLETMEEAALQDLVRLEEEVASKQMKEAKKGTSPRQVLLPGFLVPDQTASPDDSYLLTYLRTNLEVWDSQPGDTGYVRPLVTLDFGESLRQYASPRLYEQCCHCGSPFQTIEWMAAQVPGNIGVQNFSNRLEAGSAREPKRNICPVCRMQFILDKLAWRNHTDKHSKKLLTFYLHLFPYAFFTEPLLRSWWLGLQRVRDVDHTAFLLDTRTYFRQFLEIQEDIDFTGSQTRINGVGLSGLPESLSNTPVLPITAPRERYGTQFLFVLEMAVVLTRLFECRAYLSRSPIPLLNLSTLKLGQEPAVLMVDGRPHNLSWLLPEICLNRAGVEKLATTLGILHRLADILYYTNQRDVDNIPHDLAVAAASGPLGLHYLVDRMIEKKIEADKGRSHLSPDRQAILMSQSVAPFLQMLQV